jgi:hypothetical protein
MSIRSSKSRFIEHTPQLFVALLFLSELVALQYLFVNMTTLFFVNAESLQVSFPLKNTQVCDVDVFHLAQDPDITSNDSDLYAGYAILDLATQWTFWDRNSSKSWCALPAFTFELLKENPNYSTNTRLQKLFRFQGLHSGILNYEVIEMTIYYGAHFSKAFIIHPSLVLDRTWKIKDGDDDIAPCIVYANSLGFSNGVHSSNYASRIIRTFLNSYDKQTNESTGRSFTQTSLQDFSLIDGAEVAQLLSDVPDD